MRETESLRFDDVVTFLTVHHTRSISSAARQLRVTPSQVSKAVARLEDFVGEQLLARGPRGVSVSMAGLRAIPMLEELARGVRGLKSHAPETTPLVRFAASPSLLAAAAGVLAKHAREMRFSCIELDPVRMRTFASEDVFDVAIVTDDRSLGELYEHEPIGETESCLFARPSLAQSLGPAPVSIERVRELPFVMPIKLQETRLVGGNDLCPLPFEHRIQGHAAATLGAALELAKCSDHLVFGPRVAAREQLARRELVVVDVADWSVRWKVHLACHTSRVPAKTARSLKTVLLRWLEE